MKAISIWQPHASLIVHGIKPYETRSWPAWKSLVGQRICIHAGKALNDLQDLNDYLVNRDSGICTDEFYDAYVTALKQAGFKHLHKMPRGAILGTAILAESIPTATLKNPGYFGDFTDGRFAWRMVEPIVWSSPLPFLGKQGFFNVPDAIITPHLACHDE